MDIMGHCQVMQRGEGNRLFDTPEGELLVKKVMSWEGVRREFGFR